MSDQLEMAGPAWTEMLRAAIEDILRQAGPVAADLTFSISERYTGLPAHLAAPGVATGWCARIEQGALTFVTEPDEAADVLIEADYTAVVPLARIAVDGDPERARHLQRLQGKAIREGAMKVTGDASKIPAYFAAVHDRVAHRTA